MIDVKALIEQFDLDANFIAKELFPGNLHAKLALNRIMNGDAVLDERQISRLASIVGLPIDKLFRKNKWKATTKKSIHYFNNEEYRAELDRDTWTLSLYHKDSLFHESVFMNSTVTLTEVIEKIDSEISNNKK